MGSITKLKNSDINTHILLTKSSKSEIYVYDVLKDKVGADRDSIYEVDSKKSFENMLELINVQSFLSDKWLFVIDYSKVKKLLSGRKSLFMVDTSEFLIKVKNYKDYKEAKEMLGDVNDIYLSYINFYDVEYLLRGYEIPDKLITFVYRSYSSDPEQVFTLYNELKMGNKVTSRKQITEICGVSAGSLNTFVISLLGDDPKGVRGSKTVIKNRIKVAVELSEVYGYRKMRNFLLSIVKDILDIKVLYLEGVIYDRISDLPDVEVTDKNGNTVPVYDEKKLSRYRFYFNTIKEIPYNRIVNLYLSLKNCGMWNNDSDMVRFIYGYYVSEGESL